MTPDEKINVFWSNWHDLNAIYEDYARKSELSYMQLNLLEMVSRIPDCTQKIICENTLLPKQNVNAIIKKFEADGLVELLPDKTDRRSRVIKLTKQGMDFAGKIVPGIHKAEKDAMAALTEDEQDVMIACLNKYVKELKNRL